MIVEIIEMTATETNNKADNLCINYSFANSEFGSFVVANTPKGICYMAFEDDEHKTYNELTSRFPFAKIQHKLDPIQQPALNIFDNNWTDSQKIKLHIKGTDFQLKVWKNLIKIPTGKLSTYGQIAQQIGMPTASRAVGTAIGRNPIAFIIPCHRVVQSSGAVGGYMWGSARKKAIIEWETSFLSLKQKTLQT